MAYQETSLQSKSKTRPKVFIASSVESLRIARAIRDNFEFDQIDAVVWDHVSPDLSRSQLETLLNRLSQFDFGIFVFAPDDITTIREQQYSATRDNVIFEFGLFVGKFGRERSFLVQPRNIQDYHLPTDLRGVVSADYDPQRLGNPVDALSHACGMIKECIESQPILQETPGGDRLLEPSYPMRREERIARLNRLLKIKKLFAADMRIFRFLRRKPQLIDEGELRLSPELSELAGAELERIMERGDPNYPHAILRQDIEWDADEAILHFQTVSFAGLTALRKQQTPNGPISACAVVFCDETRQVFLHQRSKRSKTYGQEESSKGEAAPSFLHTFGGAFLPHSYKDYKGRHEIELSDGGNLLRTAWRKIQREMGVMPPIDNSAPMLLSQESSTGFIQLAVPIKLPPDEVNDMKSSWEGEIVPVLYEDLEKSLPLDTHSVSPERQWVPTGKAQVLSWLALGAPGCAPETRFGDYSATELFDKLTRFV